MIGDFFDIVFDARIAVICFVIIMLLILPKR